jgi:hypothetical protein
MGSGNTPEAPRAALRSSVVYWPGGEAFFLARPPENSSQRSGLRSSGMPCLTRLLRALEGVLPGTEGSYSVMSVLLHFALAEVIRAVEDCGKEQNCQPLPLKRDLCADCHVTAAATPCASMQGLHPAYAGQ